MKDKNIIQTLLVVILLLFGVPKEQKAQSKLELHEKNTISITFGNALNIEYRKKISANWYLGVATILSHKFYDESGDIPIGENSNNIYRLGAKLLAIYHKKFHSPISLNFGGGIVYIRDSYHSEIQEKGNNSEKISTAITEKYGLSFISDIEVRVYKNLSISARYSTFTGIEKDSFFTRKYYLELKGLSIGAILYW